VAVSCPSPATRGNDLKCISTTVAKARDIAASARLNDFEILED